MSTVSLISLKLRWRGPSRQSSQRHSGNGNNHRTGGQAGQAGSQGGSQGGNNAWGGSSPAQDLHVSVRGFNATEAKNILKRGRTGTGVVFSTAQSHCLKYIGSNGYLVAETKPTFYKPNGKDTNNQRSGGPWGAKSNTMANGKDFYIELRKQVASLQKAGPPVGG
ncbi:hypothetical protein N7520_010774 [Penicillium odoratum]|uniref:uncharacterized protein n=1 Tax=Penicillium odoratum TaxID=1167516 RepID=UPI0025489EDA|nr:uncharacterized protein N7520_010774 [Penicillium odoratum]KAJ5745592.1 hypothetical protein N7520_010774 [Penicillium odoratum]